MDPVTFGKSRPSLGSSSSSVIGSGMGDLGGCDGFSLLIHLSPLIF